MAQEGTELAFLKYVPFCVFPYLRTLLLVFRLRMHFFTQFTVLLMKGA